MAKKIEEEIKKLVASKNIIIGTEKAMKLIKSGKAKKVFVSSNCPEGIVNDIEHYSKISHFEVVKLRHPNDEVGALCKKPYHISVFCTA